MNDPFLPAMEAVCKALDKPKCERCGDTGKVTLYGVNVGGFEGDADDQPCPECQ